MKQTTNAPLKSEKRKKNHTYCIKIIKVILDITLEIVKATHKMINFKS